MSEPGVQATLTGDRAPASSRREGTGRFGWCLTSDHARCWVTNGRLTCPCDCPDHGANSCK